MMAHDLNNRVSHYCQDKAMIYDRVERGVIYGKNTYMNQHESTCINSQLTKRGKIIMIVVSLCTFTSCLSLNVAYDIPLFSISS